MELTAAGCLEAVRRILTSPLPDEVYKSIENALIPVFNQTFTENGLEFIEECLSCLNLLLYHQKSISE